MPRGWTLSKRCHAIDGSAFVKSLVWAFVVSAPLLTACIAQGRHDAVPRPALPAAWIGQPEGVAAVSDPPSIDAAASPPSTVTAQPNRWWRAFGDDTLGTLIEAVLANNADLALAAIAVHRAQLQAGLVGAETGLQPSASGNANASREFGANRVQTFAGVNATVSYELDLWGKLAARRDEASWRAQASEADRAAAALALISTTAKLYWQIGYLNEAVALERTEIADAQLTLARAQTKLAAGAAMALDVAQARQQLAQLQAELTETIQQRESTRNALALLLGGVPEARGAEPADLRSTVVPQVPGRVPAAVLARRPDVRAAELRVRAQMAHVDFARASFYPSFALTGELGTSSDMLVRTLQNPVASLGVALALPFIQWNTVRLNAAIAQSDLERTTLQFRQALYRALAEVEDALSGQAQLAAQAAQRDSALSEARLAATLARTRFEAGATDVAPLLDAQRIERAAAREQARNRLARLENRMGLFLAFGGD